MDTLLYIDNEARGATDNETFARRSPVTGEVVTQGAAAKSEDALAAVDSAQRAFVTWSQTGPGQRRVLLMRAAVAASPEVDLVHVNTEFAEDAMRGSDHDPVISRFVLVP